MRRFAVMAVVFLWVLSVMSAASAGPGQRAWLRTYNGPAPLSLDEALRVTTTSHGGRIFVAGLSEGTGGVEVLAYRYSGEVAWRATFQSPSGFDAIYVENIVVSVDDREVVITVPMIGVYRDPTAVVGFDAATGHLDWTWLSTPATSYPTGLAAGPGRIFMVGSAGRHDTDWLVVALRPLTGQLVWSTRYDDPLGRADPAGVAFDRGQLFVTGSVATRTSPALRTVAYSVGTGRGPGRTRSRGARPERSSAFPAMDRGSWSKPAGRSWSTTLGQALGRRSSVTPEHGRVRSRT
jgi:outer membrane protein assembly factor BamB